MLFLSGDKHKFIAALIGTEFSERGEHCGQQGRKFCAHEQLALGPLGSRPNRQELLR